MKKTDLHVHSIFSRDSRNALIKAFGIRESYVEPEEIFEKAAERGMDFITITDLDTIEGCRIIKEKYPDKVIMGVEVTARFPEDGCPVHILIYGLNERQFRIIESLKNNIYELRNYLQTSELAHSVAHTTYRLSEKFTAEHAEKLLVLFSCFEVLNGNLSYAGNAVLKEILENLTPDIIYNLAIKHGITPYGPEPWIKGLTGGTDDHSGLFIGSTWTEAEADSPKDFVAALRSRNTLPGGGSRSHKGFAFELFKIGMDNFARKGGNPGELVNQLSDHIFSGKKLSLANRLKVRLLTKSPKKLYRILGNMLAETDRPYKTTDEKLNSLYDSIAALSDEIIRDFADAVFSSFSAGNLAQTFKAVPRTFAGCLAYIPAFAAWKLMNRDKNFHNQLREHFIRQEHKKKEKNILWFTDTISDLNGVAVTLKNIGWMAWNRGDRLKLAVSLTEDEKEKDLPPNIINLEPVALFKLPYYEKLTMRIPSVLGMIEILEKEHPDEVFISTPGLVGLAGLIFSKIYGIKSTTVYHTDFTMQAANIISPDADLVRITEAYTKWFYESSDRILVPTQEYIRILTERGFSHEKMGIFYRGINTELFTSKDHAAENFSEKYGITGDVNLLFAGRISEDKNLDFLIEAVSPLFSDEKLTVNLIFAGDGPYLPSLKRKYEKNSHMFFLGQVENSSLPEVYSGCDMLVFPSETDTFGMVVLEAQSCGRPALVSNIGGPKNIIADGKTGFILSTEDPDIWTEKLRSLTGSIAAKDVFYRQLCADSRKHVLENFDASRILDNYIK